MRRRGRATALTACLLLAAVLGTVLWVQRDAFLFRWKLGRLAAWDEGRYAARSVRRDLPEDVATEEAWFLESYDRHASRLRDALRSTDPQLRLAAAHLLGLAAENEGRRPDLADFWQAFEDAPAVEHFGRQPARVIVIADRSDVHSSGSIEALAAIPAGEDLFLWRLYEASGPSVPSGGSHPTPAFRPAFLQGGVLRGSQRELFLRDLGRVLHLGSFESFEAGAPANFLECRFFLLPARGAGSATPAPRARLGFTGWAWLDELLARWIDVKACLDAAEPRSAPAEEEIELLLHLLDAAPPEVARLAAGALIDLRCEASDRARALDGARAIAQTASRNADLASRVAEEIRVTAPK